MPTSKRLLSLTHTRDTSYTPTAVVRAALGKNSQRNLVTRDRVCLLFRVHIMVPTLAQQSLPLASFYAAPRAVGNTSHLWNTLP